MPARVRAQALRRVLAPLWGSGLEQGLVPGRLPGPVQAPEIPPAVARMRELLPIPPRQRLLGRSEHLVSSALTATWAKLGLGFQQVEWASLRPKQTAAQESTAPSWELAEERAWYHLGVHIA